MSMLQSSMCASSSTNALKSLAASLQGFSSPVSSTPHSPTRRTATCSTCPTASTGRLGQFPGGMVPTMTILHCYVHGCPCTTRVPTWKALLACLFTLSLKPYVCQEHRALFDA